MKARRTSTKVKNTSKRNVAIRKAIRQALPAMKEKVYAEYPYSKIANLLDIELDSFRGRKAKSLKADVFVRDYFVAVEAMGEQHFRPVAFGGDPAEAERRFKTQQQNDRIKREIAELSNGRFKVIELPYNIELPDSMGWLSILHQVAVMGADSVYVVEEATVKPIDEDGKVKAYGKKYER